MDARRPGDRAGAAFIGRGSGAGCAGGAERRRCARRAAAPGRHRRAHRRTVALAALAAGGATAPGGWPRAPQGLRRMPTPSMPGAPGSTMTPPIASRGRPCGWPGRWTSRSCVRALLRKARRMPPHHRSSPPSGRPSRQRRTRLLAPSAPRPMPVGLEQRPARLLPPRLTCRRQFHRCWCHWPAWCCCTPGCPACSPPAAC